ncbi:hypothetical protein [Trinickia fusca]|uniref:Glycoside hydrolase family 19 catalytic domain-containing protein n=1 Tax=Trinickia fusca TaxID=2419777 RepID=A0A494XA13_9BURK|nr:hypothetical protein [Trinickia fusca]RKP46972.1 hypothetical protein D7S89_16630 [Trinickia fusca]
MSEQHEFEPSAQAANGSALLLHLEKTVSRLSSGDHSSANAASGSVVTAGKLQQAMRERWLASELSHVILRYESEWGGDMSRWEALTPLMKNAQENWKCELQRIKKLQWWSDVKGKVAGFPSSPVVYHIHPIALILNFSGNCTCINIDAFCEKYKIQHQEEFGWFEGGAHKKIPPLNDESSGNLKKLLAEMLAQYPSYFKECNNRYLAYMLATARVESYDFIRGVFFGPFVEHISYADAEQNYGCGTTATAKHRARAISMGNTEVGDGFKYRGRGLVQLTFKKTYAKFSGVSGTDLTANPDRVLELALAVKIMMLGMRDGLFSGQGLSDYLDGANPDYVVARAIINGSDKASQFAYYAQRFEKIIKETRWGRKSGWESELCCGRYFRKLRRLINFQAW